MQNDRWKIKNILTDLTKKVCHMGASDAKIISTSDVSVEDDLAKMCQELRCENYGHSAKQSAICIDLGPTHSDQIYSLKKKLNFGTTI